MKHVGIILALLLVGGSALAQRDVQSPEDVANAETGVPFVEAGESYRTAPSILDMIYECNRAAGSVITIYGRDYFRTFGFDFIDAEIYALNGPRAFSAGAPRAESRAMSAASRFLFGVSQTFQRTLADSDVQSQSASSTGAPNSEDRERISSVSTSAQSALLEINASQSSGTLRGGFVSGTKIASLGDNFGYCIVVRYDIPLDQSSNPTDRSSSSTRSAEPAPPAETGSSDPGGFDPLPPGEAGDF